MSADLKCNIPHCQISLGDSTYILSCGHALCKFHNTSLSPCPICSLSVTYFVTDITRPHITEAKKLSLIGYPPTEILESASIALEFWTFQRNFKNQQVLEDFNQKLKTLQIKADELQEENTQLKQKCDIAEKDTVQKIYRRFDTPVLFSPPVNTRIACGEFEMIGRIN